MNHVNHHHRHLWSQHRRGGFLLPRNLLPRELHQPHLVRLRTREAKKNLILHDLRCSLLLLCWSLCHAWTCSDGTVNYCVLQIVVCVETIYASNYVTCCMCDARLSCTHFFKLFLCEFAAHILSIYFLYFNIATV